MVALQGNEILQVVPIQTNGQPGAIFQQVTTQDIANLAAGSDAGTVITALNTVGAGTITAASIAGEIVTRGGAQSATPFTDTTATAALIIAALPTGAQVVGNALDFVYVNNTDATATIAGGVGVTVTGQVVIPPNGSVRYLLTIGASSTIAMVGYETNGFSADATDRTKIIGFKTSGQTTAKQAIIATQNTLDAVYTLPPATADIAANNIAPIAVGAALTITTAMCGAPIMLDTAAGSVATLPAATGSGRTYKFFVKTTATSNAHKILAASVSDFLNGIAVGHVAAGTTLSFSAAAATAHSIQMPFAGTQPSGGFIGDWYEFTDVAANLWDVKGAYLSGTTSTTPFSAATS